jgi:DNA polymerase-3 subunit alpha
MKQFTHLHVHTEFSLLDGSAKIRDLVAAAKAKGMTSLAITDHGVMFGVVDFYKECMQQGIKPIIGCEVYVAPAGRHVKERTDERSNHHLVLLAQNNQGYSNLVKLVSLGFTEGFYYKPRVDMQLLKKYSGGLIALSGCLSGVVPAVLSDFGYAEGKKRALEYAEIFGAGNFYLEIQENAIEEQRVANQQLLRIAEETGLPLVATNDVHYIARHDAEAQDILLCIQTQKNIHDEDRMVMSSDEFYLKTPEEMYSAFSYAPSACENTVQIAGRCEVSFEFGKYKLPLFDVPGGGDTQVYLRQLCMEGLRARYGEETEELVQRLDFELQTIGGMCFTTYFLIVWDFIRYARENGIMVGPGRGSGAGSLVAYVLRITDVDPIPYNLLFEMFLNPERISMPDFDIDFCYERRHEVIKYVNEKYGADHVAQIVTFGTMKAKAVVRDVARALAMPYASGDRISKMIPFELKMTLDKALKKNDELQKAYNEEDDTRRLIDMAKRLEGLARHAGTHAAGVVICDKPVSDYVPLNMNDGVVTTQFPMGTCEELGLLKMDFLGLRTLTVIRIATEEVARSKGIKIDLDNWSYDDTAVYESMGQGKTSGVFQLESSGMTSFFTQLKPTSFEDVTAGISLFRPGPMDYIPDYVKGKNNPAKIRYDHPLLKPILETTYGVMVYQEQVMQIVQDLAGYSLGQADILRRAMGKKNVEVMAKERGHFIEGCAANKVPEKTAGKIFDKMAKFAEYAFNKSHAAGYAVIAYQTAWLKHYHPVEFMAALMTSIMENTDRVAAYIREARKMGIKLLPPDVNTGLATFSVDGGNIRYGLTCIKNVGRHTVDALVRERAENGAFTGMADFVKRMSTTGDVNKRCIESLVRAGAFDSLGGKRSQYLNTFPGLVDGLAQQRKSTIVGQLSLFETDDAPPAHVTTDELPPIAELPQRVLLSDERTLLGVYVSGHPLADYAETLATHANVTSVDFVPESGEALDAEESETETITQLKDKQIVKYGGMITAKKTQHTKRDGSEFAFLTVEDMHGSVEVLVFPKVYEKHKDKLHVEQVLLVNGRVSVREDEAPKITADSLTMYEDIPRTTRETRPTFWLKISEGKAIAPATITAALQRHAGNTPVIVYHQEDNRRIRLNSEYWVAHSDKLVSEMEQLLGEGNAKYTGMR